MVLRRLRRARQPEVTVERQPDDLPKHGLFAEPVRVASLQALDPEPLEGDRWRVAFLVEVRDAADARCPDVAVEATVAGPERTATARGTTDMMGRLRVRTTGPAGTYRLTVEDVAAGGLDWERDGGPHDTTAVVPAG